VYVSAGNQIYRFLAGASQPDSEFSFTDAYSIVDISADGPLVYVLDTNGVSNRKLTVLSWDGTAATTNPISLAGIGGGATPLRIVARGGSVYISYKPSGGGQPFATALVQ